MARVYYLVEAFPPRSRVTCFRSLNTWKIAF
jgi:hypothetical protein